MSVMMERSSQCGIFLIVVVNFTQTMWKVMVIDIKYWNVAELVSVYLETRMYRLTYVPDL